MSIGGSKGKSKQTTNTNQTQTNALSDLARSNILADRAKIDALQYKQTSADDIQRYMSPYQQQVIDASMAQLGQQRQQAFSDLDSRIAARKAFGNDRRGILEAELAGEYDRNAGSMLAGLLNQGYGQALGAAQQENQFGAGFDLQKLGALTGLNSLLAQEGTQKMQGTSTSKGSNSSLGFSWTPFGK